MSGEGKWDDAVKHQVERIDKVLEDSRALGRLGIGTSVTLAMGVLAAHAKDVELIKNGPFTLECAAFTLLLCTGFALWWTNLHQNDIELARLANELTQADNGAIGVAGVLRTKPQLGRRRMLYWLRVGVVFLFLFAPWLFVVDIVR